MVKVQEDISNKKYGRLTVIRQIEDHITKSGIHLAQWLCKCDCGNQVKAIGSALKYGHIKSCGCMKKKRIDITNKKIGMLTALYPVDDYITPQEKHLAKWHCICDCGNECDVVIDKLIRNITKSCGCLRKQREDLTGQKFGRLTVLYMTDTLKGEPSKCCCLCDCGEKIEVLCAAIKSGQTKSCGCYQKEIASKYNSRTNHYDLSGEYGIGWDVNANEFYFDLEDYDLIKDYCWYVNNDGYVVCVNSSLLMHRLIMDCRFSNVIIDHIHGKESRNDNRKSNLREGNKVLNAENQGLRCDNTSGYTGVTWNKNRNKWYARITVNKEIIDLGSYVNKEDAIKARKIAEEKYFGEWSYDNSQAM